MGYQPIGHHHHGQAQSENFFCLLRSSEDFQFQSSNGQSPFSQTPICGPSLSQNDSLFTQNHPELLWDLDLDLDPGINPHKDYSRVNNPRAVLRSAPATRPSMSGEPYRLQRFQYSYSTCPSHVLVCLKGTYSLLAFKCFFCGRDRLGVIYQCNNCGTYICGSCKESNRKFKWTRGKDPEYFGK